MKTENFEKLKSGCYFTNPEQPNIQPQVPLKNIDYSIQIANSLANISLIQKYHNPIDKFLNVYYSLPINPNSSIYQFQVQFANTKIQGIIKEKQQAKKQFNQAKKQGKQTVIGTIDPTSKDIINFEIGNIPPKSQFIIIISMLQQMKISLNTFYKLHIPSTISPRYMNKINQKTQISQHQIKKAKSTAKSNFTWTFKIDIQTTKRIVLFNSPTHNLTLLNQNKKGTETLLVMQKSQIPNKDFIFLYTTQNFHLPSYVLGNTDISSTIMLSFIPKFCELNINDAYKAQIKNKSDQIDIKSARGDYVFLLDRSGSMEGQRIQKAKQSLILFIKSLPQDSYFNIISFGSTSQKMFKKSQIYTTKLVQQAINSIQKMQADMGGTQIFDPLSKLLDQKVIQGYPRHIFLLTDGEISNTQGVIQMVTKNTKFNRVHTIGIGYGVSLDLINGCAQAGKGKSIIISDEENPSDKIIELLQATLTPLISKIKLTYENKNQIQSIFPNPNSIPYILKDQIINFYITYKGPLIEKQTFQFTYEDSINKLPYKSTIQINPSNTLNLPFVDKMAHFKIIKSLENSAKNGITIQDQMYYVKVKDFQKQAIDYSIKHQVLSEYTAFICVGKHLIDGQYQEFQNKGVYEIQIEQPQPKIAFSSCSSKAISYSYGVGRGKGGKGVGGKGKVGTKRITKTKDKKCGVKKFSTSLNNGSKSTSKSLLCLAAKKTVGPSLQSPKNKLASKSTLNILKAKDTTIHGFKQPDYPYQRTRSQRNLTSTKMEDQKQIPQHFFEQKQKETTIDISKIVKLQQTNGSWEELSLIEKLAKQKLKIKSLIKQLGQNIVLTQLVILWIQKHHPQKQYALIIKKALSWLKKNITEKSIQEKLKTIKCI